MQLSRFVEMFGLSSREPEVTSKLPVYEPKTWYVVTHLVTGLILLLCVADPVVHDVKKPAASERCKVRSRL